MPSVLAGMAQHIMHEVAAGVDGVPWSQQARRRLQKARYRSIGARAQDTVYRSLYHFRTSGAVIQDGLRRSASATDSSKIARPSFKVARSIVSAGKNFIT